MEKEYFRDLLEISIEKADVIFTGICYDEGCSCGVGASQTPKVFRELSSFLPALTMEQKKITTRIYDNGDIHDFRNIENSAQDLFNQNKFCLFIGGDHSITIPLQKAFYNDQTAKKKKPVIIHIDAHPDICHYYNNSYFSHACTNRRALDNGYKDQDLVMIGIRGYEEQEMEFLKVHPDITIYSATNINNNEIDIDQMIDEICHKYYDCAVYLSYDIDANDPCFAPGTGTPEAFGLNSLVLLKIILKLFQRLNIQAMDIVEISPPLDNNNVTTWLALKTLYEILPLIKEKR